LANRLRSLGFAVVESREPTTSVIGQEIRRMLSLSVEKNSQLLTALALCFAADRMQHIHDVIAPALKNQDFIILDRYVLSSLVYQGLHLPAEFVNEINKFAIKPDLTMILDIDPKLAYDRLFLRIGSKDFYETPEMLSKLRSRYLHFAKDEPDKAIIDAQGTIEAVERHIFVMVEQAFIS
jgi:dTMP kinase